MTTTVTNKNDNKYYSITTEIRDTWTGQDGSTNEGPEIADITHRGSRSETAQRTSNTTGAAKTLEIITFTNLSHPTVGL